MIEFYHQYFKSNYTAKIKQLISDIIKGQSKLFVTRGVVKNPSGLSTLVFDK